MNSPEEPIRRMILRWAEAARRKDMAGVLLNHAKDMVMFDVPEPLQSKGLEEYKKTWELFFNSSPGGPGSFEVDDLTITAGDTVAFAHGVLRISSKQPVGRLTIGLRKVNDEWIISHEHHSYPVDLEAS
jgi:ketosteroid isomerase-like protein